MRRSFNIIVSSLLFLFLVGGFSVETRAQQSKKEKLKKKREQLLEDIGFTKDLLHKTRENRESSINELVTLRKQIEQREDLVETINDEIRLLDQQVAEKQEIVNALERDLDTLKAKYADMIVTAYKTQNAYTRLLFLFSAQTFNDLFQRMRYIDRYTEYREQQAAMIKQTQKDLQQKIKTLNQKKQKKKRLLAEVRSQKARIKQEIEEKNQLVYQLKQKEQQLREEIEEKRKTAADLKKAIEDIIRKEMQKAKKEGKLSLTPEAAQLSKDFTKNKGKLPWPVKKGIITSSFGKQPHPVLEQVYIQNNGIDIKTAPKASVRSIFGGEVKKLMYNPSFHRAVMIQHGNYFTVYSNLKEAYVEPGEKVSTKQVIGQAYHDPSDNRSEVHLEVWKGTETLDPQEWLYQVKQ